ncbi:MAG TPA: ABC transporter substrate-binding protein, partial [Burkholderiaceae bacterium]|nr:ABC transporter substrate-binding protein [Burkholderiaceae bacterium]
MKSLRWPALGPVLLAALIGLALPASAQIRVGMPSGFTGPVAPGVKENADGAKLYLDAVNAKGGVHGQKVELVTVDDKFDPKLTVELGRKLIVEQNVIALFLNRGTPHSEALIPLLREHKVPLVAPSTGAMLLHDPVNPYIFNVRATYQREAEKAVQHLASIGITRIGILQTDDSFGADAVQGALRGLQKAKLEPLFLEKLNRAKPDIDHLASVVAKAQPQA